MKDRFLASDPGLVRLTLASRAAVSLAVVLGVAYLVSTATGLPALVMLVLGAVLAMMTTFTVADPTLSGRLATQLSLPVVMLAGLSLAALVDHYRVLSLVLFVVVMFVVVWIRRFGPRFFACGMVGWMGYFIALFLTLPASGLPAAVAAVLLGSLVLLVIAFVAPQRPARRLRRMLDSFAARVRIAHAGGGGDRAQLRVNEAAVLIDGQLAIPGAVPDDRAAACVRDAVLSVELALAASLEGQRCGVADADRPRSHTDHGDADLHATLERLAVVRDDPGAGGSERPLRPFTAGVDLFAGFLPGSVVTVGSMIDPRLAFATRQAFQVAIAAGLAIVLGDLISGQRWYWAVLACFLAFTGTATAAEAVTKAAQRTVGTVIGVGLALVVVPLLGNAVPVVITVVLVAIFVGFYLFRVSYTSLAVAITVVVGELYELLGSFSGGLLALRIGETALGAVIGAVVAVAFLPASAHRAETAARERLAEDLRAALVDVVDVLAHPGRKHDAEIDLPYRIRSLDAGLHQLALVGVPLVRRTSPTAATERADLARHLDGWVRCATRVRAVVRAVERHDAPRVVDTRVHDAAGAVHALAEGLVAGETPSSAHRASVEGRDDGLLTELGSLHGALLALHEIDPVPPSPAQATPALPAGSGGSAGSEGSAGSGGFRVHGRVTTAEAPDAEVPDAVVTLLDVDGHQRGRAWVRDGRYEVAVPSAGVWRLVTAAPGRAPRADRLCVGARAHEVVHDVALADAPRALTPR